MKKINSRRLPRKDFSIDGDTDAAKARKEAVTEKLEPLEDNSADKTASDMAVMMYNTATLRSGYSLKDPVNFAHQIKAMMRKMLGVDADEQVEEEEEITDEEPPVEGKKLRRDEEGNK